ncbi:MAG: hypothetical protein LBB88_09425, partial [Planctomycetaceae bacterium]|nr:hypothetical protein [Planctomycetaceae bacterium]
MNDKNKNTSDSKVIKSDTADSLTSDSFFISVTENNSSIKSRKKRKNPPRPPQNIFSDETALWLINLLNGKKNQPESIESNDKESSDNLRNDNSPTSNIPKRDPQESLAAAIRQKCLPCFWSMLIHLCILIILAILFLPTKQNKIIEIIVTKIPAAENIIADIAGIGASESNSQPSITAPIKDVPINEPQTPPPTLTVNSNTKPLENKPTLSISTSRSVTKRNEMSGGNGNTTTDKAIIAALNWLISVQNPDGS